MKNRTYRLNLSAEFQQFYLRDEWSDEDVDWTEQENYHLIATNLGVISVGTNCDRIVPVEVEVRSSEPQSDFEGWDHVIECGIDVPSGRLNVAGCVEDCDQTSQIRLKPSSYRARVYYGNQYSCNDYRGCDDHYKLVLWPGIQKSVRILKRRADLVSPLVA